jgi:hypothetical protein
MFNHSKKETTTMSKPALKTRRTRSTWNTESMITKARGILRRVEQLDTCGCWDFENTRNQELAVLQVDIDLLEGPYLTLSGLRHVEEMLGLSQQWIDDAETNEAEEE